MEHLVEQAIKRKEDRISKYHDKPLKAVAKMLSAGSDMLLHGGTAINMYLPEDRAIYSPDDRPDYDVFFRGTMADLEKKMHSIRKDIEKLDGGKYGSFFSKGFHGGTLKLFAYPRSRPSYERKSFPAIMDATSFDQASFCELFNLAELERTLRPQKYRAMNIVPTAYLKMSFHLELSRPRGFIERWRKIYPRMTLVYGAYPKVENWSGSSGTRKLDAKNDKKRGSERKGGSAVASGGKASAATKGAGTKSKEGEGGVFRSDRAIMKTAFDREWLLVGSSACGLISEGHLDADVALALSPKTPRWTFVADTIDEVIQIVDGTDCKVSRMPETRILPESVFVTAAGGGRPIARVYSSTYEGTRFCHAFNPWKNLLVGSPDLVLRFLYGEYISEPPERPGLAGLIDRFTKHLESAPNTDLSTRLVNDCV